MISLRHHVISLTAAFLALAVGVVLGSTAISDRLLSGLSADRAELGRQVGDLRADADALRGRLVEADRFALVVGPRVVRDVLPGRSVVVLTTPDADPGDRDALVTLLGQAGATVTGELQLTDEFTDPARSEQLGELSARLLPAGVELPATSDPAVLAGGLLGALLLVDPAGQPQTTPVETTAVLAGLGDGGFVGGAREIAPAQLAVVLTGDGAHRDRARMLARFATELDRAGAGTVLAGRSASADPDGPVGVVRADTAASAVLSTVDHVGTAAGRVVTVLALAEQARGGVGRYGTAGSARATLPAMEG